MSKEFIARVQRDLKALGYDVGPIDGIAGDRTGTAWGAHMAQVNGGPALTVDPFPSPARGDVAKVFGAAGNPQCTAGSVVLPFPFVIAWDQSQRVSRFSCHAKVAPALMGIFSAAASHYGEDEFRRLRLDQFGGCYNFRPMRGGTSLSMHAWGIAVDLDPINNQLTWGRERATFAKPEYDAFWQIVEAHGGISLGRERNRDWMHWQFAKL